MRPQVSVVIPTFRRVAPLERTLLALARQAQSPPFEVVVCDDGSPPDEGAGIGAAVERAAGRGLAVRLVRQKNAGPAAARNAGARAAAAPLLLFLDDDCAPAADLLARHWAAHAAPAAPAAPASPADHAAAPVDAARADERPERLAVMGHVAWDPALRVTPFMELVVRGAQFNYGAITDPQRVPFTCFYTANCSLRRETLVAAGWFDAALPPYMEDTEFAYRLTQAGGRIAYLAEAVVYHEHAVELAPYLERQRRAGRAAVAVARRHPELFDTVGAGDVANVALREEFYNALLRYAFVLGVEDALLDEVAAGTITGAQLRGRFEEWVTLWGARQAGQLRRQREQKAALERAVAERDEQLAAVVQAKDSRIAQLEGELARINALPPVALLRLGRRALRRVDTLRRRLGHQHSQ